MYVVEHGWFGGLDVQEFSTIAEAMAWVEVLMGNKLGCRVWFKPDQTEK